jgi:poly(A) polymerase
MAASRPDTLSSRLDPAPDWLTRADTAAVMAALSAAGGEDAARFVGGCVRDTLTGHKVEDIDIATRLTPDAVIAALEAAGLKSVATGVEHGTVTAIASGRPFEITTLRRDVETDGRRAVVAFTQDWTEDAQRRDFRLNAVYADRSGALFDPTGAGVADARAGRIVFVGDAAMRVREDYLRILRFFRFFAWYGEGAPDAAALAACAALKDGLAGLAAERVTKELLKLLAAPDPRAALRLMAQTGVLAAILPKADDLSVFEAMVALSPDPLLRLAALAPRDAAATATALRLSNAQRDRLIAATAADIAPMDSRAARAALYADGAQTFADRARLAWAAGRGGEDDWAPLLALAEHWSQPVLPVNGADAVAAGIAPGPAMGAALRAVEAWWVDEDFAPDRAAVLERLAAIARAAT